MIFLPALSVKRNKGEFIYFYSREAADIDGDAIIPLFVLTSAKGLYSAGFTKEMLNHVFIETVFGHIIFAGKQRKLSRRNKSEKKALDRTVGTVALDNLAKVRLNFILHLTTVAPTGIFRHNQKVIVILSV